MDEHHRPQDIRVTEDPLPIVVGIGASVFGATVEEDVDHRIEAAAPPITLGPRAPGLVEIMRGTRLVTVGWSATMADMTSPR